MVQDNVKVTIIIDFTRLIKRYGVTVMEEYLFVCLFWQRILRWKMHPPLNFPLHYYT